MDGDELKHEIIKALNGKSNDSEISVIELDSSDEESSDTGKNGKRCRVFNGGEEVDSNNKRKKPVDEVVLPEGFLDPLPPKNAPLLHESRENVTPDLSCKQFWKAGDFEGSSVGDRDTSSDGMDHARVHPKFLHSNATSHKWVLGAFAELLDNSLDETCNGATYVKIDMLINKKDGNKMLLIEDDGGGMDPDKMRQCMSLGYSQKSKAANTIGQYGNGFKTSTMRLGADAIVFSRSSKRSTQSIGVLSYTFLRTTGKEYIVVPMLDYERDVQEWKKMKRSSANDWDKNVKAMIQWTPFSSEEELMRQFDQMKDQGTRIIIYNLWEDDQGELELDFDVDIHDIQIRGVNRDEKSIKMAQQYPNSKHFLTYRHSLRSYASILYLRVPPGFRMILRGKDVEHHNIINDMMMIKEATYRPHSSVHGWVPKDSNLAVDVAMGFVKDAKSHIDVQGFNVYHKNRLIKPFWRVWNAAGSDGRGVIGVLEANFVEPAHDKQGFERTTVLSRLEVRLIQMQKTYWNSNCHKIGYSRRRKKKNLGRESSPHSSPETPPKKKSAAASKIPVLQSDKHQKHGRTKSRTHPTDDNINGNSGNKENKSRRTSGIRLSSLESTSPIDENTHDHDDDDLQTGIPTRQARGSSQKEISAQKTFAKNVSRCVVSAREDKPPEAEKNSSSSGKAVKGVTRSQSKVSVVHSNQLIEENLKLKESLRRKEEDLEREKKRSKKLQTQLEDLNKEQEKTIDVFKEERERRDFEEENLRKKLQEATAKNRDLVERVRRLELEKMRTMGCKLGR